jgi:hypothetical protein
MQRPSSPFKAFNGRFTDGPEYDESRYAKALADEQNMQLYITDIGEQDFVDNISKDKFIIQPNLTTESTLYKIPMILRHGETDTLTLIEYADETNLHI